MLCEFTADFFISLERTCLKKFILIHRCYFILLYFSAICAQNLWQKQLNFSEIVYQMIYIVALVSSGCTVNIIIYLIWVYERLNLIL